MDLKKLFVYVPNAQCDAFVTNVINVPAEAAKYANKIVFLEKTSQIWVKGNYYGSDPADLEAVYTLLTGSASTKTISKTVGDTTYTNFVAWIDALAAKFAADDEAIISAYEGADQAIITAYEAADQAIITAYEAADSQIITDLTGYMTTVVGGTTQFAYNDSNYSLKGYVDAKDQAEIDARTAAINALDAKLPAVAVSGSGLSLTTSTDEQTGKTTYTVVADQSIWEFMGAATATSSTVDTVLNGKYGDGEGQIHRAKEAGDVWAVTITDQSNNTILYAWDGSAWVQIGSAQGVSGVDTTASHGIALTNTASVVGINVEAGSIADGNTYFVTGGDLYTKFNEEHDLAYAYAEEKATEAQTNSYAKAEAEATAAQANAYAKAEAEAEAAQTNSYAKAEAEAAAAQANSYAEAAAKATAAQDNAYAYAAAIRAAGVTSVAIDGTDAAYMTATPVSDENGTAYTISFSEEAMFNYVSDNIWENYSAS